MVSSRISCTLFVSPNDVENKSRMVIHSANREKPRRTPSRLQTKTMKKVCHHHHHLLLLLLRFHFQPPSVGVPRSFCVCLWTNSGRMKDPCGYIFTRSSPTSVVSFRPLLLFFFFVVVVVVVVVVPIFPIVPRRMDETGELLSQKVVCVGGGRLSIRCVVFIPSSTLRRSISSHSSTRYKTRASLR